MNPVLPTQLNRVGSLLPKGTHKPVLTKEEKLALIKKKFNLQHGKGNRKKKK